MVTLERPPRDAGALGGDIRRLRDDPALRTRLGAAARCRAESLFDAPAVVERIERLYSDLLERRR